jgi:hypothetical protein
LLKAALLESLNNRTQSQGPVGSRAGKNHSNGTFPLISRNWKLPMKRKGVSTPKPSHEEGPPEMSDEELAKIREESRAMFDQLRKSLRGRVKS